jgi:hypothetical protein
MANKKALNLPQSDASMAAVVLRLEDISKAVQATFGRMLKVPGQLAPNPEAYAHFRVRAFRLLVHYVDSDRQEAFRWLLLMYGAAPKKARIRLQENPFHWGLLAMTAAAGPFMSRNRLRTLAAIMKRAHEQHIDVSEFEEFARGNRFEARH